MIALDFLQCQKKSECVVECELFLFCSGSSPTAMVSHNSSLVVVAVKAAAVGMIFLL